MDENLRVALHVGEKLSALGVRWFVGGSLASSLHGVPRSTLDADIVADLRPSHVSSFVRLLGDDWYADEAAIRDALAHRTSFNVINMTSAMKVDIFIPKHRPFDGGQFSRVLPTPVSETEPVEVPLCAAEDIIAVKLEWFRLGQEISERQWGDIVGVLKTNRDNLDIALMRANAVELGVADLLIKALGEAGMG
jgi:hypothetical protein